MYDVHKAIFSLTKTATGQDNILYWALKLGVDFLSLPISQLFNKSLQCCTVPRQWKTSIMVLIPKCTAPATTKDYRPISLTSILSRTFERLLIHKCLYPAIVSNKSYFD